MAVGGTITGRRVILRPVEDHDAEFTLQIRNDEELTRYIPKVESNLERQRIWINYQRRKEGDYFYIIENLYSKPLGTLAYYDILGDTCELGRYISYGSSFENVEAATLILDVIFAGNLRRIVLNNDERNQGIISFWKKFGAVFVGSKQMEGWRAAQYLLVREEYLKKRGAIAKLLDL